jgi:hypothetical protein
VLLCPLCVDTPRAGLEYEPDQLVEHATKAHAFEDIYRWTRERMIIDHASMESLDHLDAAFGVVETFTTSYFARRTVLTGDTDFGWMCRRCWTTSAGFADLEQAQQDRLDRHGCPL